MLLLCQTFTNYAVQYCCVLVTYLILPLTSELSIVPPEMISILNPTNQKSLLLSLAELPTQPDWTILPTLDKLDIQDCQVQMALVMVFSKQGHTKDVALGKFLLSVIKTLPRNITPKIHETWQQIVSMHQSFLKKACENELKKIVVINQ